MIEIIIGGDICPLGKNESLFKQGNAKGLFNDLLDDFERADLSIINLECPFIKKNTPILKNGPVLGVPNECINGFSEAGIDIFNLANNHILDHGVSGLTNTLKLCEQRGIETFGSGENIKKAEQILIKEINGLRIGFLGIAENEFSIATESTPGANPLNIIRFVRNIKENQGKYDYLIVFLHSGINAYTLPSPKLMETCRFIAEMGAHLIICQHSHCPGCFEKYNDSYIVYGQGNLIFDRKAKKNSLWNKGFLIKFVISDYKNHSFTITPYEQSKDTYGAKKILNENRSNFFNEIKQISEKLSDPLQVRNEWIKLCNERKHGYYFGLFAAYINFRIIKFLNRKFNIFEKIYSTQHLLVLENYFKTESHREIIQTILEEKRKKSEKNKQDSYKKVIS
ncbi:MAG: hypothetical protein GF353_02500 [Candidatus Lokiarchaeota archaeon]|nr:hypothetical protein [Candidatus Lokiarchaeota archaeon]